MTKIETSLNNVVEDLKEFYDYKKWHFLTLNGVGVDENTMEIQWIFSKYEAMNEIVIYYCIINYKDKVPSIAELIPSAMISQREVVDMFGIDIEGSEKGLYLDEDSLQKPLSGGCAI